MHHATLSLIFSIFLHCAIFGQSFLKISPNATQLSNDYYTENTLSRFGIGLGVQKQIKLKKSASLILGTGLDINSYNFSYYHKSNAKGGTFNKGDLSVFNLDFDARIRVGKKFFGELGVFGSLALQQKLKNQEARYLEDCAFPQTNCAPPYKVPFENTFNKGDFGLSFGVGYQMKKFIFFLDYQRGLLNVANIVKPKMQSRQVNMGVIVPFSLFVKKEAPVKTMN